jgi:hypothetical protein
MSPAAPTRRRWFQFRLSTALVLVAILAWAMATQPNLLDTRELIFFGPVVKQPKEVLLPQVRQVSRHSLNPRLCFPAFALLAFISWKAFWLIRERRRELQPPC